MARSRVRSARPAIINTLFRNELSASSNVPRICFGGVIMRPSSSSQSLSSSSESSGDVVLGPFFGGIGKDFRGRSEFDQPSEIKKSRVIRDAPGLLHVVSH